MKLKHLFVSFTLLLFLFSCTNAGKKDSVEASKNTDKKVEVDQTTTQKTDNESDKTLIYKVSLGVLPDLAYDGIGIRAAKVHKDRPGYNGGMQEGDIVTKIDGKAIKDLLEYTKILSSYKKGDSVVLTLKRGDKTLKANITFD